MGHGREVHSHAKSCTYKYEGAVGGYPDSIAQHLSRGLPSACGIDGTLSCCNLLGERGSYRILGTYPMTFGTSIYAVHFACSIVVHSEVLVQLLGSFNNLQALVIHKFLYVLVKKKCVIQPSRCPFRDLK
jgi:hypothetical protein